MPTRPWVMRMCWEHLAFMHWRVDAENLRSQLPAGLELDTFDGDAWLGVVPFSMTGVAPRGLPELPPSNRFLELNLRTYVRCQGRPGVWFFSLDAESRLAVRGARTLFHLPYFDADMDLSVGEDIAYRSRRTHRGSIPGRFRALYRPTGEVRCSDEGGLEHWLTERYCLYSCDSRGRVFRGDIHHEPWPLQAAACEIRENSLGDLAGVRLTTTPDAVHFAKRLPVVAWALERC